MDAERLGMEQRLREAQERLTGVDPNDTAAPTPEQISKMLKHLEQMTKRNRKFLEKLPSDPAGAIDQLRQYEFMDEQARSAFDDLQSSLEQKVLDASINELTAGFASGDQDQRNLLKEMLQEAQSPHRRAPGRKQPIFPPHVRQVHAKVRAEVQSG